MKKDDSKRRILALERIMLSGKPISLRGIISRLDSEYDIQVERKTVYADLADLTRYENIQVVGAGRYTCYQLIKGEHREGE